MHFDLLYKSFKKVGHFRVRPTHTSTSIKRNIAQSNLLCCLYIKFKVQPANVYLSTYKACVLLSGHICLICEQGTVV
jgi:hypothetical protein